MLSRNGQNGVNAAHGRRRTSIRTTLALTLAIALVGITAACAPATQTPVRPPLDIYSMTDSQADLALQNVLPTLQKSLTDPVFTGKLSAAGLAAYTDTVNSLGTAAGRSQVIGALRTAAAPTRPTTPGQDAIFPGAADLAFAPPDPPTATPTASGIQSVAPAATPTEPPVDAVSGPCSAPDGVGVLTRPAGIDPGGFITPPREAWTTGPDAFAGVAGGWSVVGRPTPGPQTPVQIRVARANGTSGPFTKQLHVQVNIDNAKFPVGALTVILKRASLTTSNRADDIDLSNRLVDIKQYCYAGDNSAHAGYFDAWVNLSADMVEPGFQITDEVVENENWFAPNFAHPERYDALLSAYASPQFWAGADRATIHVGATPVATTDPVPGSVGAFATAGVDGSAGSVPNLLTDTNGQPGDDLERTIRSEVTGQFTNFLLGFMGSPSKPLFNVGAIGQDNLGADNSWVLGADNVQFPNYDSLNPQVDISYVPLAQGFDPGTLPNPDKPTDPPRALQVKFSLPSLQAQADLRFFGAQVCAGFSADIGISATANAWVESSGNTNVLAPKVVLDTSGITASFDWDKGQVSNYLTFPLCELALAVAYYGVPGAVDDGLTQIRTKLGDAIRDAFGYTTDTTGGQTTVVPGAVTKLTDSLDLNQLLHDNASLTLPAAPSNPPKTGQPRTVLVPAISNIDNSWCRPWFLRSFDQVTTDSLCGSSTSLLGRPGDDLDLLGPDGLGIVGDGTVGDGQAQPGVDLGGRFPNVFRPSVTGLLARVVDSHRDASGKLAAVGVTVDPVMMNLVLRHLAQGPGVPGSVDVGSGTPISTDTNGMLDVSNYRIDALGGDVSTTPRVAPMVLGNLPGAPTVTLGGPVALASSPNVKMVLPDLKLSVHLDGDAAPITFSASAAIDVSLESDPATGALRPHFNVAMVDPFITGGCKVDYVNAYAASYGFCGRGSLGPNGFGKQGLTLTSLVGWIANQNLAPIANSAIGSITLPDLSSVGYNVHLRPTNVRFAQIAGHLSVVADIKAAPSLSIVSSIGIPSSFVFTVTPDSFVAGVPITYQYVVTDLVANKVVDTVTTAAAQLTEPVIKFATYNDGEGLASRRAKVVVTATQVANGVTRTATFTRTNEIKHLKV